MAAKKGLGPPPLPLPPTRGKPFADFHGNALPSKTLPKLSKWWRTQDLAHRNPLYFGNPKSRVNRFDIGPKDCPKSAGALYTALTPKGAFIEVFGHSTGTRDVTETEIRKKGLFQIWATRDLVVVSLTGRDLARLGLDSRIWSGDVAPAQAWATAIYRHPQRYDGLYYPCRHDNSEFAVALFDRTSRVLKYQVVGGWWDDQKRLGRFLDHYEMGLL